MNNQELKNKAKGQNNNTIMAVIFIVIGAVLMVANVTDFSFQNWWALFMLIPLAGFAQNIYSDYRANGRLTSASTGAIITSLAILLAASIFLFEAITWGMIWPVGLIFAGLSMFLGSRS
ncbi:LiaF transmembrane domain-containing protein [Candidatus Leptofilum sp.]|uniref:LiaF transmembrane domain-containing protein n=1 Tax=Candidatus Leptofilum sp. TaxID=3241576 RepID=UPI003B5C9381